MSITIQLVANTVCIWQISQKLLAWVKGTRFKVGHKWRLVWANFKQNLTESFNRFCLNERINCLANFINKCS
jgi:hypothetical protein